MQSFKHSIASMMVLGSLVFARPAGADVRPHAGMLRYPDISRTDIVFSYANELWIVSRDGGLARPIANPPGPEIAPHFSPDGRSVAFVGNYDGNYDLYTVAVDGGVPVRVSHHPDAEILCDWTADGRLLYYSNEFAGLRRQMQLFTVSPEGGMPTKLPVPYGANGSISADGRWLAYTPHTTDRRTWKRYRGGMATDIWLFDLKEHKSKKITDWEGTDTLPMWHGDVVYYLSDDGKSHRLNIWAYDTKSGKRRQITDYADYDVKWPSMGPGPDGGGEVVYQHGASLERLDVKTGTAKKVDVLIPGDRRTIRSRSVDPTKNNPWWTISPSGKRGLFEMRGDIWTVPAEKGPARNMTRTCGVAERTPTWSPDGKSIAYFSDASGEYELYVRPADGTGEARCLTHHGPGYRYAPIWSPDSKYIAYCDKAGCDFLCDAAKGESKQIDRDDWGTNPNMSWSSDSKWLAYTKLGDNQHSAIWVWNVDKGDKTRLTSGRFSDAWPTFDRKGEYLFFVGNRAFSEPIYEDEGTTFVYANTGQLYAVPLRDKVGSPWAPKSDEEELKDEKKKDEKGDKEAKDGEGDDDSKKDADEESEKGDEKKSGSEVTEKKEDKSDKHDGDKDKDKSKDDKKEKDKKKKKNEKPKPVKIELEGFEARAVKVPVPRGNFSNLAVNHEGHLLYTRAPLRTADEPSPEMEEKSSVMILDLKDEKKKEKTVVEGVRAFDISADGKKLIVKKGETMAIIDAAADQKMEKTMPMKTLTAQIDPREEWKEVFTEAWRVERDFFYDPHMHGVDWNKIREDYSRMLDDCVSREDVSYVIGEMISELNVGHAYVLSPGDVEKPPEVSVGMLGADYEVHDGAFRIKHICHGAAWDADGRGPLSQPGTGVKEGDYLLAVNGVPLDPKKDPWTYFQGTADTETTITVSKKPTRDKDARDVVVKPLASEAPIRYRDWVEHNRAYVESKSNGQVGYIHVPSTGVDGQNELFRQFYGQIDRAALIVDERWNSGGQIPTRFIELLNRPLTNYWARRDHHDTRWPPDSHQGPKCMLINGLAGSGGDAFPAYFKQAGVGKLIGMRTWGGLVGISGNPECIDGGSVSAPTFAFYRSSGAWGIEGHGVDPDIMVVDDPALMADGGDPQLDRAIELMRSEIAAHPYRAPARPAYPDRKGMGVPVENR